MKTKIGFTSILCLIWFGSLFSQTTPFDSMDVVLKRFQKESKRDSALAVAKQMRDWAFTHEGDTSLRYAVSWRLLGKAWYSLQEYDSAEVSFLKSLSVLKLQGRNRQLDHATCLEALGNINRKKGLIQEAESKFKECIEIRTTILGNDHIELASAYNNLGFLYLNFSMYEPAKENLLAAVSLRGKILGKSHPLYAKSIGNLGFLYSKIGDFETAENYLKQACLILKNSNENVSFDYATSLHNLGTHYVMTEEYSKAISNLKEAGEITRKILGENSSEYIGTLSSIAVTYKKLGDFKSAERMYLKSLELNSNYNFSFNNTLNNLINLGNLYFECEKFSKADSCLRKSLFLGETSVGLNNIDASQTFSTLGWVKSSQGDGDSAIYFFNKSNAIILGLMGKENRWYAQNQLDIGLVYVREGRLQDAEELLNESKGIFLRTTRETSSILQEVEMAQANLLAKTNRGQQGLDILLKTLKVKTKQIADNFEWLSDLQKEAYWKQEAGFYDQISLFADISASQVPEVAGLNYDSELISKGKLLENKISSEQYYREIDEIREALAYRRRLVNKMESEGTDKPELLERLRREADSLDKRLALSWPEYAEQKKNLSITWQQVRQNLLPGEAAIEFVRFQDEDSVVRYNALLLRKDDPHPLLVRLCTENQLRALNPKTGFQAYHGLLWEPLEGKLAGVRTLYYAPTGELHNVPFHAAYDPKAGSYAMDRIALHQLTSTRYLAMDLRRKEKQPVQKSATTVGGLYYDHLPGQPTQSAPKTKKGKALDRSSAASTLGYLDGTRVEVERIGENLVAGAWQTVSLRGEQGTEENVVRLEGKEAPGVLHLATHGYAFPEYDFSDTTGTKNALQYSYRYSTNPMVRSGLILTGGNWAWTGSDTLAKLGAEQNGILTALEVSQLDLRKTKLVVLSACETGLGSIDGAEGTFGLKRGFKLAGVEQIVVSLWPVPDKETMELMTAFYKDLATSLDPVASFAKAQKQMRGKYPENPEKWAGFVLVR